MGGACIIVYVGGVAQGVCVCVGLLFACVCASRLLLLRLQFWPPVLQPGTAVESDGPPQQPSFD